MLLAPCEESYIQAIHQDCDMPNSKPYDGVFIFSFDYTKIKASPQIISALPGMGKTKSVHHLRSKGIKAVEVDIANFYPDDDDFHAFYVDTVDYHLKRNDYVFITSHMKVLKELDYRQSLYKLYYPENNFGFLNVWGKLNRRSPNWFDYAQNYEHYVNQAKKNISSISLPCDKTLYEVVLE